MTAQAHTILSLRARRWHARRLSLRSPLDTLAPVRPGRPERPELVPPTKVVRRSLNSRRGRIALLHAIAHIELNAVDLALDIVARFAAAPMPQSFFDGWMQVAFEEAKHFNLVRERLQASGLDVTPSLRAKMREVGDHDTAAVLDVIYEDEKKHVAVGAKWFRFICAREGRDPAEPFRLLVRANFRGGLKPPFNDLARAAAGLTPTFYRALSSQNMS